MDDCFSLLGGKVVEVEGNIGCGKSTLTKLMTRIMNNMANGINEDVTVDLLSKQDTTTLDIIATSEKPVFAQLHGELVNQTFLSSFYKDPVRYGFAFQMYMLTTRLFQMQTASQQAHQNGQFALLDRGAVGDALFALYNASTGNISPEELDVYKSVCADRLPSSLSHKVDLVIYLDVSPLECFRRMNSMRQRDAEKEVVPDYLEGIDNTYFELMVKWIGRRKDACGGIDIGLAPAAIILDWSSFGCSKGVLQHLALGAMSHNQYTEAKSKQHETNLSNEEIYSLLIQPTVDFIKNDLSSTQSSLLPNELMLDNNDDVNTCFQQMLDNNVKNPNNNNSIFNPKNNASKVDKLFINWNLTRNNEYRRLCMKFLSRNGRIVFYNSDHTDELISH